MNETIILKMKIETTLNFDAELDGFVFVAWSSVDDVLFALFVAWTPTSPGLTLHPAHFAIEATPTIPIWSAVGHLVKNQELQVDELQDKSPPPFESKGQAWVI